MEKITVETSRRTELVEITEKVSLLLKKKGIRDAILHIYVPHTTCGLAINENADPSVKRDIISRLGEVVPRDANYTHSEGNSDAHIKSVLTGCSLSIFVEDGLLRLGTWQGIFLCEFDGPRRREVWIKGAGLKE